MKTSARDSATLNKWEKKLEALMDAEAKKNGKNRANILLGVQTKDKTLDFRYGRTSEDIINPEDPYFIASQTKLFTATVIFQLVDEKKIKSLNDPISDYLPLDLIHKIHVYKGKDYSSTITVEQLLHQTSGLPDYFLERGKTTPSLMEEIIAGKDTPFTVTDVVEKARNELTPRFQPMANSGKRSFYSDTNFQLLGAVIEAITKMSIRENFESRIFQRLGLSEKTYLYDYKDFVTSKEGATNKHHPMKFYYKEKELNIPYTMGSFGPDGGIVSTLDDMLTFLRAYFDGQLFARSHHTNLETQRFNTVFAPPIGYGLGLMRFKLPVWMTLGRRMPILLGHSGANASFAFYAPEEEVFLVGTFNRIDQESRPYMFMMKILQCLK